MPDAFTSKFNLVAGTYCVDTTEFSADANGAIETQASIDSCLTWTGGGYTQHTSTCHVRNTTVVTAADGSNDSPCMVRALNKPNIRRPAPPITEIDVSQGLSWQMISNMCAIHGQLCSQQDLCDNGRARYPVNISWNAATWLPVSDGANLWIQYGPGITQRKQQCLTFQEVDPNGDDPVWGSTTALSASKHTALCCHLPTTPAPVGVAPAAPTPAPATDWKIFSLVSRCELPQENTNGQVACCADVGAVEEETEVPTLGCDEPVCAHYYTDIPGTKVRDLKSNHKYPHNPDEILGISTGEFKVESYGNNYGVMLEGFVRAPATGRYIFITLSDDTSEVWVSNIPRSKHAGLRKVVSLASCCQTVEGSVVVNWEANKEYYIKGLMKQGTGGNYLKIGMQYVDAGWRYMPIPLSMFAVATEVSNCDQCTGHGRCEGGFSATPYGHRVNVHKRAQVITTVDGVSSRDECFEMCLSNNRCFDIQYFETKCTLRTGGDMLQGGYSVDCLNNNHAMSNADYSSSVESAITGIPAGTTPCISTRFRCRCSTGWYGASCLKSTKYISLEHSITGKCLSIDQNAGTPSQPQLVLLAECNTHDANQLWRQVEGQLVQVGSGLCLVQPAGAPPYVAACLPSVESSEIAWLSFSHDVVPGLSFLQSPGNWCLNAEVQHAARGGVAMIEGELIRSTAITDVSYRVSSSACSNKEENQAWKTTTEFTYHLYEHRSSCAVTADAESTVAHEFECFETCFSKSACHFFETQLNAGTATMVCKLYQRCSLIPGEATIFTMQKPVIATRLNLVTTYTPS